MAIAGAQGGLGVLKGPAGQCDWALPGIEARYRSKCTQRFFNRRCTQSLYLVLLFVFFNHHY